MLLYMRKVSKYRIEEAKDEYKESTKGSLTWVVCCLLNKP